jgi:segregation and condensation protein A
VTLNQLDVELEVFQGPFDLLLTLILNEEIDLAEVDLADLVTGYLDHLEASSELDLEVATEFCLLVASLLELKSRLIVGDEETTELEQPQKQEAASELLEAVLTYRRYRDLAGWLQDRMQAESSYRYRSAPLEPHLRQIPTDQAAQVYDPLRLTKALGGLLATPEPVDLRHMRPTPSLGRRLEELRGLLASKSRFDFDHSVLGADTLREAITVFALLELYKTEEADWHQETSFGPITVVRVEGP